MIIALFAGIVLIGWGILCFSKYQKWNTRKKRCTKLVHARVIQVLEKKPVRGSDMLYKPIFLVEDHNIRIDSAYYSNLLHLTPNTYIDLLVDTDNYNNFIYAEKSLNRGIMADIVCCCLPIIFLVAILIMIYNQ